MFRNPFLRPTALIDFPNQLLVLAKPDAVHNGQVGTILRSFEFKSFWIRDTIEFQPPKSFWAKHYCDHVKKPFYKGLVEFMTSGLTIAFRMEYVGPDDFIAIARQQVEKIRKAHFCVNPRNLVHASDSLAAARRELNLWFPDSKN